MKSERETIEEVLGIKIMDSDTDCDLSWSHVMRLMNIYYKRGAEELQKLKSQDKDAITIDRQVLHDIINKLKAQKPYVCSSEDIVKHLEYILDSEK